MCMHQASINYVFDLFQLLCGFRYLPAMLSANLHSVFFAFSYFLQPAIDDPVPLAFL